MRNLLRVVGLLSIVGAGVTGCAYGSIAATPAGAVVITRNDTALFGALRKVFVCTVNGTELACGTGAGSP